MVGRERALRICVQRQRFPQPGGNHNNPTDARFQRLTVAHGGSYHSRIRAIVAAVLLDQRESDERIETVGSGSWYVVRVQKTVIHQHLIRRSSTRVACVDSWKGVGKIQESMQSAAPQA